MFLQITVTFFKISVNCQPLKASNNFLFGCDPFQSFQEQFLYLKVKSAIFLTVCFVCLKESTFERRKNAFYFTLKALFILEIIKF